MGLPLLGMWAEDAGSGMVCLLVAVSMTLAVRTLPSSLLAGTSFFSGGDSSLGGGVESL